MHPFYSEFKRKFSFSMYKNLKIMLGEMSFLKDFVHDTRGDLYPVIQISDDCAECVENHVYKVTKGSVRRLFCQFFPYATYELTVEPAQGETGFCFKLPQAEASIILKAGHLLYVCGDHHQKAALPENADADCTLVISCRPGAFDVYLKINRKPEYICTFDEEMFSESNQYSVFSDAYVSLLASEGVVVKEVLSYVDNGVSIADIRPIKYENGEILMEQGKIYLTASIRMQAGGFQGIFSWIPGTAQFNLTGALFFDNGDGFWRNYLASSILYHREKKQWYLWVSAFEHKCILAHAAFDGDPRFGINVADVEFMEKASDPSDISVFAGFKGDEDPDFFYDEENDRWLMAVCRIKPSVGYVYVFFQSEDPFKNYTYIGQGHDGAETGGSFVRADGELYFVCGNDFGKKSEYRVYSKDGMTIAKFNYPDGGFRGWGTVMPIRMGSRTRYFWLTFDRHKGSDYNWSYGNIYCFEAN